MERAVTIDGREVKMRASALTPRLYRRYFGHDMMRDMNELIRNYQDADNNEITIPNLEVFENVAWLFLKEAGEDVGESPEEWLDTLDGVFSIYEAMPTIIELWASNQATTSVPKNPGGPRQGK